MIKTSSIDYFDCGRSESAIFEPVDLYFNVGTKVEGLKNQLILFHP